MDVATSSQIEPPPLLFGPRPPTPINPEPQMSSPRHLSQHTQDPPDAPSSPAPPVEMDLSASAASLPEPEPALQPQPAEQEQHMETEESLPNGHAIAPEPAEETPEVRQQDGEAMDTAPDQPPPDQTNGLENSTPPDPEPPNSPEPVTEQPAPVTPSGVMDGTGATGASFWHVPDTPTGAVQPAIDEPQPQSELWLDLTPQPPPPELDPIPQMPQPELDPIPQPPQPELDPIPQPPLADAAVPPPAPIQYPASENSTSDDEDDEDRVEIKEDTSSPDEEELKEIEASNEKNALDHAYYEKRFFKELDDPEYVPSATGRIDWVVKGVHGTWKNPNKERVMRSPPVRIGDLDWNIKYYPKGNNTSQISIYLECNKPGTPLGDEPEEKPSTKQPSAPEAFVPAPAAAPPILTANVISALAEGQAPPPPPPPADEANDGEEDDEILDDDDDMSDETDDDPSPSPDLNKIDHSWGTAAQFGVVLYNPAEPRVSVCHGNHHLFCAVAPDWGWTRFHGPHNEIHKRFRGQRQALLRNDTLAFTAYVRTVKDETKALWDHPSESEWNSLAKTGLRGLGSEGTGRGYIVAGLSSWLLLTPFRDFIYNPPQVDAKKFPLGPRRPIFSALQTLIHNLNTKDNPPNYTISLRGFVDAMESYGIKLSDKMDVMEFWTILRRKLIHECENEGTLDLNKFLFFHESPSASSSKEQSLPGYQLQDVCQVPVEGDFKDIQGALESALPKTYAIKQELPKFLTIELRRQKFDEVERKWVKLSRKLDLSETLELDKWVADDATGVNSQYTLYGFISHEGHLRSGNYQPVLRPSGPGTKWITYMDERNNGKVVALTKKKAMEANQGGSASKSSGSDKVAYIVMYVRSDVIGEVLKGTPEEPTKHKETPDAMEVAETPKTGTEAGVGDSTPTDRDQPIPVKVVRASEFCSYTGAGVLDVGNLPAADSVLSLEMGPKSTVGDLNKELRRRDPGLKEDEQIQLWLMINDRPRKLLYDSLSIAKIRRKYPTIQLWSHVLKLDIEKPEKPEVKVEVPPAEAAREPGPEPVPEPASEQAPPPELDQPMAEAPQSEEPSEQPPAAEPIEQVQQVAATPDETPSEDVVMSEASATEVVTAVVNDIVNSAITPLELAAPAPPADGDTEMGGTQEDAAPPPPPPEMARTEAPPPFTMPPPPAPVVEPPKPAIIHALFKEFDPATQTLKGVLCVSCPVTTVISKLVFRDGRVANECSLWEEVKLGEARPISMNRTFQQEGLVAGVIIIFAPKVSEDDQRRMQERGTAATPAEYLEYLALKANFPDRIARPSYTTSFFGGESYTGSVINGRLHGAGTHIYVNGDVYSGWFASDARHGRGVMTFANGDVYDGDWADGYMHGQGKFSFKKTGNFYLGGFKKDKRFGRGTMHYEVADEEMDTCSICYEEEMNAVFNECGHMCACLACARQVGSCPVCRREVVSVIRLYRT
ncbi:MAG: hypothetical protein M1824_002787 [Vezdaea acicularis]|nr:MAG: hypothetical protein M1824_002787 [Vezdaea acicularis]